MRDSSCKVKKSSLGPARTTGRRFFSHGTSKNLHPKEASDFSWEVMFSSYVHFKTKANKKRYWTAYVVQMVNVIFLPKEYYETQ